MSKSPLAILGGLTGLFVIVVLGVWLDGQQPYRFILRPSGCAVVSLLGLKSSPAPEGCEVLGNFEASPRGWIKIDGVVVSARDIVAYRVVN